MHAVLNSNTTPLEFLSLPIFSRAVGRSRIHYNRVPGLRAVAINEELTIVASLCTGFASGESDSGLFSN
jgi:hypothetical protein